METETKRTVGVLSRPRVTTAVLFVASALVGLMAYHGDVTGSVWVLALLLGAALYTRFSTERSAARSRAAGGALFVAGLLIGAIAYTGTLTWIPAVVAAGLVALALEYRAGTAA